MNLRTRRRARLHARKASAASSSLSRPSCGSASPCSPPPPSQQPNMNKPTECDFPPAAAAAAAPEPAVANHHGPSAPAPSAGAPAPIPGIFAPTSCCPICQEPVGVPSPEGVTEGWAALPSCGHRFGGVCIKRWLGMVADDRPQCPVCRRSACHELCGHPVLPVAVEAEEEHKAWWRRRRRRKEEDAGGGEVWGTCEFCRGPPAPVGKRVVKGPWRVVVGCWRLMRYPWRRGRRAAVMRAEEIVVQMVWSGVRERDPEWQAWWDAQEPRDV